MGSRQRILSCVRRAQTDLPLCFCRWLWGNLWTPLRLADVRSWTQAKNQPPGYEEYYWYEAIDRPGAGQEQFLRALMESRPFFGRIPDQTLLASDEGQGGEHVRATRDAEGSYAFVYLPTPRPVVIRMERLGGKRYQAWWYDPRTGQATAIDEYPARGEQQFTPPSEGPDWVLVLDKVSQGFGPPGQR